ncbi:uncharacterized protein LOC127931352 [Oncorhynchus keta]|uniref:uncharacterized protein LOC127931352 n=1 Tax=Oncorhynchus keta TaxID=8018 RepID=UPI00227A03D0|nr:uncharacterized protein LOC127931352 [Oncorhynchus keta]
MHLHIVTLSDYMRQGNIPRGLRWQKEPSLGQRTDDFCEPWCAILNKCSIDLMTLIVDQLKKDFIEMDNTIKDKCTALQIAVNDDGIFNELMKTNQALLSTEIKELKIKKFNQDKKDKAEDKVYFWRNPDKGSPVHPLHGRRRRDVAYFYPPQSDQRSTISASSASSFLFNERLEGRRWPQARASTRCLNGRVLPALTLVPVSSPTSRQSCYSVLDSPLYTPLDSPPDLLSLSPHLSLQPQPPHPFPATRPSFPWPALCLPWCFNKYLGYLIPVSSSESSLGFTCSA